jgi:ABC-type Na+ efflux pump permease subunit
MFNQPQDNQNSQQSQDSSPFFSMDQPVFSQDEPAAQKASGKILGLSPMQRAVIMILLFVLTCVGGALCLLLTGKIVI